MDHVYTATCTIYGLNVVGKVTGNYHSLGPGSLQLLYSTGHVGAMWDCGRECML